MDRKYRHSGYQDEPGGTSRKDKNQKSSKPEGMRQYGMRNGGTARSGIRCALCGKTISLTNELTYESTCESCNSDLHTCTNCSFFNTSVRWECNKPITDRIFPKDKRNVCAFYSPAVFVERTFESSEAQPQDPRKAFDALFKK